jgi:hypothetical protein
VEAFRDHCQGRRIFLTEKGFIGAAPSTADVEDIVIILNGAATLYIFRPAARQLDKRIYIEGDGSHTNNFPLWIQRVLETLIFRIDIEQEDEEK